MIQPTKKAHNNSDILTAGILIIAFLLSVRAVAGPPDKGGSSAWKLDATYKGDFAANFRGGIKSGATYLGLADVFLYFNTQKAGLWHGGEFLLHGADSHGGMPSAKLIGDYQVASDIEAGNHTFLYELWFRQTISQVTIIIGLQDMNSEFANCDVSSVFLNSSFGVHSVIGANIGAPIFPLTSPGLTLGWNANRNISFETAVYQGCPVDFSSNPHNLRWHLDDPDGFLWVAESRFYLETNNQQNNVFKVGAFYHQHCEDEDFINQGLSSDPKNDYGFYLVGENHMATLKNNRRNLNTFYQLGLTPRDNNFGYIGAGGSLSGLLSKDGSDVLGLAMARALMTKSTEKDETAFELTWKVQLTKPVYLQPDIQYIIHPGGTDVSLKNAVAGFLRLGLEL